MGHVFLDKLTYVVSIQSMSVANAEEVEAEVSHHVGDQNISILVLLIRIPRLMPNTRCKCEFGDAIEFVGGYLGSGY